MPADAGRLWAITAYFNPVGYGRRRDNYRIFRERLALPLLAVELAYGAAPELGAGDAEILIQLRGRDVMWQKERLLNLALAALPAGCDRVAWLDCDVILADEAWPERCDRALDEHALVQGFARARHLRPDWRPDLPAADCVAYDRPSLCRAIADGMAPGAYFDQVAIGQTPSVAAGLVWAARRDLLARHGFYDVSIIGSGDRLIAAAAFGHWDGPARKYGFEGSRLRHFTAWAGAFHEAVAGAIGVLDGDAFALWHGDVADRRYSGRQIDLSAFGFDPTVDIALDAQGVWRWSTDKPSMHAFVRDYFRSRREDG